MLDTKAQSGIVVPRAHAFGGGGLKHASTASEAQPIRRSGGSRLLTGALSGWRGAMSDRVLH